MVDSTPLTNGPVSTLKIIKHVVVVLFFVEVVERLAVAP